MNVGTIEVLGAFSGLKVGIIAELVVSCREYTEEGCKIAAFCVYEDSGRMWLFSEVYAGEISVFVVLSGVNVGTTCVSVAFNGVKVDIND